MTQLFIMRHGVTDWNAEHRLQGRTDRALTPDAGAHLASLEVPAKFQKLDLVASPLTRAYQTAKLVFKRDARIEPALIETDLGRFEGLRGEDLLNDPDSGFRHIEDWGWNYAPHGGESPKDVLARLRPFLEALGSPMIAVTHIGVMRVLLAEAHGYAFAGVPPFRIKRDRLYPITIVGGKASSPKPEIRLRPPECA